MKQFIKWWMENADDSWLMTAATCILAIVLLFVMAVVGLLALGLFIALFPYSIFGFILFAIGIVVWKFIEFRKEQNNVS